MLLIVGAIIVIASIIIGFVAEGGQIMALYQPLEVLIIGGSALGAMIIGNPMSTNLALIGQIKNLFSSGLKKKDYLELLVMMYEIFNVARRDGLVGLENHIEHPQESNIFERYPKFLNNHHAVEFFSDTMRVIISGSVQPYDLEDLMTGDIEVLHHEEQAPGDALAIIADALPGLGIVAAVLGVVLTMASIGGPAAEIGHKVGAALVGTFLGVLGCYGLVGPLAAAVKHRTLDTQQYLGCMKHALLSFHKGVAGVIAVEFARRSLPGEVRPGFLELEQACNDAKKR